MSRLFRLRGAMKRDPAITRWMEDHDSELGAIAEHWFGIMRDCGEDVLEVLHDGHPTACIGDSAVAYVNAFASHVNVGFFQGTALQDPASLLEGTGQYMRHVKLAPGAEVDEAALRQLIHEAFADMRGLLRALE